MAPFPEINGSSPPGKGHSRTCPFTHIGGSVHPATTRNPSKRRLSWTKEVHPSAEIQEANRKEPFGECLGNVIDTASRKGEIPRHDATKGQGPSIGEECRSGVTLRLRWGPGELAFITGLHRHEKQARRRPVPVSFRIFRGCGFVLQLLIRYFPVGQRRLSSSNQLRTMLILVIPAGIDPSRSITAKNRRPWGSASYALTG